LQRVQKAGICGNDLSSYRGCNPLVTYSRNAQPEDFRDVIRMLECGRFPVDQAITHTVAMEETPAILAAWDREPARFGKVIIDVSE
jgi:threonine dehydrogenase-like Zn-dependent dehydrogenase